MSLEQFKNRNVGTQDYKLLDLGQTPTTGMDKFYQVVKRTFKGELFVGLGVTMREMVNALFRDVCPELAIVHGPRYETASEQRASFSLFEDMLTPIDKLNLQQEYDGFGAVSPNADENIKKTPLAY